MSRRADLVRLLADGEFHSGEALARELGVTRAAVSKQVRALRAVGLGASAQPRLGYRLDAPLDLLDAPTIAAALPAEVAARRRLLEVLEVTDSTNTRLLAAQDAVPGRWDACLAEYQEAGRGRRGRTWLAPYAAGLCFSYAWTFPAVTAALSAVSLAVGVAALRALHACGARGVSLKWPNDLQLDGRKLGGILCELRAEAAGPAYVVAGLGLNVRPAPEAAATIVASGGLPPASLAEVPGFQASRNRLAAELIAALTGMALAFEREGFAPLHAEWSAADALVGRAVLLSDAGGERAGIARGIAPDGTLQVEIDGRLHAIASGEVTVRPAA